jgi:tetratricopeptide (TPR) repeat protein
MKHAVLLAALLAGCATAPGPEPTPPPLPSPSTPQPAPAPAPEPPARAPSENVAVAGLMQSARSEAAAGRFANSAATIERALRIEPRNPRLWQELARVRLKQGEYAQAESVAARSNSWAGSDNTLRAENWRLIAESREARGDAAGAQKALETAGKVGR